MKRRYSMELGRWSALMCSIGISILLWRELFPGKKLELLTKSAFWRNSWSTIIWFNLPKASSISGSSRVIRGSCFLPCVTLDKVGKIFQSFCYTLISINLTKKMGIHIFNELYLLAKCEGDILIFHHVHYLPLHCWNEQHQPIEQ